VRAESLRLQNFRSHLDTTVRDLAPQINVFSGPNGIGKTSILEALSLATLTKSFTTASDAVLVRTGAENLLVEARFRSDLDVPQNVAIDLTLGPPFRKTILLNNERLRAASDLIGRAPVVVLTPDDKVITNGPPAERRRFLNVVLSQANRAYLEHEIEFRRALKQRNSILSDAKLNRRSLTSVQATLDPWTEMVIEQAARILERRARFTEEFKPYLLASYQELSDGREEPDLSYQPMGLEAPVVGLDAARELLREQLKIVAIDEWRRGTSLIGAHRDDLLLYINKDCPARDHASQGQHKTLLISMKLAEFRYLAEACAETPMLLLDDVFSELDEHRAARLLNLAEQGKFGQTFITSTDRRLFEKSLDLSGAQNRMFDLTGQTRDVTVLMPS